MVHQGRGMQFVDIQLKVPPWFKLLILKRNSYFNVNKRLSATKWTTLYFRHAHPDIVVDVPVVAHPAGNEAVAGVPVF